MVDKGRNSKGDVQSRAVQRGEHGARSSLGLRGVTWHRQRGYWVARIRRNISQYHLGCYPTAVAAALSYDRAARKMYGPDAFQNFKIDPITETIVSTSFQFVRSST